MPKLKYTKLPEENEIIPYFLLAIIDNNGIASIKFIEQELIKCFNLKPEDLRIKFTNSNLSVFHYRFLQVKRHLEAAEIIKFNKTTEIIKITQRGIEVYEKTDGNITLKYLKKYKKEYSDYKSNKQKEKKIIYKNIEKEEKTQISETQQSFKVEDVNKLFFTLKNQLLNSSFEKFKKIVIELLYKLEYGTKKKIKKNIYEFNNSILKGVIYKDNLNIGVSLYLYAIHAFNGVLEAFKFQEFINQINNANSKILFITNADLSTKQFYIDRLKERNINFLDATKLSELLIKYQIGIKKQVIYTLALDENFK